MIDINSNLFNIVHSGFNKLSNEKSNKNVIDFKQHPVIIEHELYKYDILNDAKNQLLLKTWKEKEIGTGNILRNVKNAINVKSNNLVDWRKKDDFKKLSPNKENEKFLFEFYKSKIKDEIAFNNFIEIGFSYQLIAYLFFIKNHQKYMPISQEKFDEIFNALNIDFKTSNNISWENYLEFNGIIKQFRKFLSQKYKNVSLLDAHSFLWLYGFYLDKEKEITEQKENNLDVKRKVQSKQDIKKIVPKLETYEPKKVIDLESLSDSPNENEIDYIDNHRKLIEIGELAEKIVYDKEKEFLKLNFPDLADKVRIVSDKPQLGFDILSFEVDGKQKQIEVKAISTNKNVKSFIITRNEYLKSKIYSNYYIYCVTEINSENPKILRIKNPDFENNDNFMVEPLTYKVIFE